MRGYAAVVAVALSALVIAAPAEAAPQGPTVRHMLDTIQPELKFTDVPLSEALDYVGNITDSNMLVDWKSLEAANIDRNTLINVHLRHVTLRKALTAILNEAGSGNLLTFYIEDNVLQITTAAKADTVLFTKVYPVQDLLINVPNFSIQDVTSASSQLTSGGGGGQTVGGTTGGGGGGGSSSSSLSINSTSSTADMGQTPQQAGDDLVKLIMATIRPEVWHENGGNSSIRFFRGLLIVTAPISVHEAIGGPVD